MEEEKKFAYKGFKKDMKCLNFQYAVGCEYTHTRDIMLCHSGFHYCDRLTDVLLYYSKNKDHIFCIVEPSGQIIKGGDKNVCKTIKIVRQLTDIEVETILSEEAKATLDRTFCLDIIRELQNKYNFMIGGSISLHLAGFSLKRDSGKVDLDIIMPYYQKLENQGEIEIEEFDCKASGNDYSISYGISTPDGRFLKADIRICPSQKYEIVEYKGYSYKVCEIMTTLEAKCRYAMEGNKKHRDDILFLLKK